MTQITPIRRMLDAAARFSDAKLGAALAKQKMNLDRQYDAEDVQREAEADFEAALSDYLKGPKS